MALVPSTSVGGSGSSGLIANVVKTATFSTASATPVQVTGLTTTFTATGGNIQITVAAANINNTSGNAYAVLGLWDGVVGVGTQIGECSTQSSLAGETAPAIITVVVAPTAGSKTYNVSLYAVGGGTAGVDGGATKPASLIVVAV